MKALLRAAPLAGALGWVAFAAFAMAVPLAGPAAGGIGLAWIWPTPWRLLLVLLAVGVASALVFLLQGAWLKRREADKGAAGAAWLPSLVLWLFPLAAFSPLWRLTPAPLAVLHLLAPLAGLAAGAGLAWFTWRAGRGESEPEGQLRCAPGWLSGLAPWILAAAAFVAAAGAGYWQWRHEAGQRAFGGDETSYLLMAHSLAVDKTLDLSTAVLLKESYLFQDPAVVVGGHGRRRADGAWASVHRPGLPLLLAPFHAWGLYLGKSVLKSDAVALWLLFAWLTGEVFLLCRGLTGLLWPADAAAAAVAFTLPGLGYANVFFPEIGAAAFLAGVLRRILVTGAESRTEAFFTGCLLAYLPWFNERFIPLSGLLVLLFLWGRPWRDPARLAAFFAPLLLSAGLMMHSFWLMYGHPWPSTGVHMGRHFFNPEGFWQGLLGLLLDGAEGLAPQAPLWIWGLAGLAWLWRVHRPAALVCLAMAATTWLATGVFISWHGGVGPAGRYWVGLLPVLAAGLACGLAFAGRLFRFTAGLAGLASLGLAAHFTLGLLPAQHYGHQAGGDLGSLFPVFSWLLPVFVAPGKPAAPELLKALLWLAPLALGIYFLARRPGEPAGGGRFALALAGWLGGLCLLGGAADLSGPGLAAYWGRNQQVAIWSRLAGLGPRPFVWPRAQVPASALTLSLPPARFAHPPAARSGRSVLVPALAGAGPVIWGQYLRLPAGHYKLLARVESPAGAGAVGWLDATARQGRLVLARRDFGPALPQEPLSLPFSLASPEHQVELRVGASGSAAFAVHQMGLVRVIP